MCRPARSVGKYFWNNWYFQAESITNKAIGHWVASIHASYSKITSRNFQVIRNVESISIHTRKWILRYCLSCKVGFDARRSRAGKGRLSWARHATHCRQHCTAGRARYCLACWCYRVSWSNSAEAAAAGGAALQAAQAIHSETAVLPAGVLLVHCKPVPRAPRRASLHCLTVLRSPDALEREARAGRPSSAGKSASLPAS